MRRVIETTQSVRIGACIYCGTKGGTLHEEHITPYGLNGRLTLLEATCDDCAKRTSAFETTVLRKMLFAARAAIGTRTRRPKERLKPQPMLIEKNERLRRYWRCGKTSGK
jgi:5-methylcytosine-specific restriction endonuclease McrA